MSWNNHIVSVEEKNIPMMGKNPVEERRKEMTHSDYWLMLGRNQRRKNREKKYPVHRTMLCIWAIPRKPQPISYKAAQSIFSDLVHFHICDIRYKIFIDFGDSWFYHSCTPLQHYITVLNVLFLRFYF